ncbi:hypothetical protein ACFFUB_07355 [Algimonas porphyrae]|uniref:Uncharacterized protein n=1 Tax=Algimonas porphyrae TaxID=1128113 RepID=A0ABQ5V0Q7_9PROT|nr:hypothetical protein [Algimonas porphyrae]GLQ21013.1 hypothetical protein GCM10007854_19680 [Algimonas porphyrae]
MSRPQSHTSRRPGPTENEIALQWEIDRLRKALATTRKALGEDEFGHVPGDRLTGEAQARFYEKLGRFTNYNLEQWVPPDQRCTQCGGLGLAEIDAAFAAAASRVREGQSSKIGDSRA